MLSLDRTPLAQGAARTGLNAALRHGHFVALIMVGLKNEMTADDIAHNYQIAQDAHISFCGGKSSTKVTVSCGQRKKTS